MLRTWLFLEGDLAGGQTRSLCSHERKFGGRERARGSAVPCSLRFALSGRPLQVTTVQPVLREIRRILQVPGSTRLPLCDNHSCSRACGAEVAVQEGGVSGFYFLQPISRNSASSYCSLGFYCHYLRWGDCFDFIFYFLLAFDLDFELGQPRQGEALESSFPEGRTGEDCRGGQSTQSPPLSCIAYVRATQSHSWTAERRAPSRSLVTGRAPQGLAHGLPFSLCFLFSAEFR